MMDTIWQSFLLVIVGILFLRVAGRKSISQMTLAQTVVMISIGSIIIQPIIETSLWKTVLAAGTFIAALIILEFLQLKFDGVEKFITGKSKIVIQNGVINEDNLNKLRFTVDQLEMRLRQKGVTNISDVNYATLEPNGQLGYELMPQAKPLTVGEFEKRMGVLLANNPVPANPNINQFDEITMGHQDEPPEHLQ